MENTNKKITKANRYEDVIAILNGEQTKFGTTTDIAVDFLRAELELLNKKNAARKNSTSASVKISQSIAEQILPYVESNPATATEIQKRCPELAYESNQRITSALNQLIKQGFVQRSIVKGRSMFALV